MLNNFSRRARLSALLIALVIAGSASLIGSPTAQADDAGTLTVVGTSDVFDSNLVQTVIKPGFEEAYPQYDLNYVSKGTGAAISFAEAGTASAMLVHAAALENQFVADGYSSEKYGRAIFWGDYVLLGPDSDPAGVLNGSTHDVATAFEKIATAGDAGDANFVSRGGTPGTTVQEHAIWALTSGVGTCDVSSGNGGGKSPSTVAGGCNNPIDYPSWYHATGLTQGPNITNADACNYSTAQGVCYVLTDRGTFNYLESTNAISNLRIVTRDNAPASRGGEPLLVNSFHAYGINPAKFSSNPNVQINKPAADAFLKWITSPEAQTAVGEFLNDSDDAPFLPSAAPAVTNTALPTALKGAGTLALSGLVKNVVPGTPALGSVPVILQGVPSYAPTRKPVKYDGTYTASNGHYGMNFNPLSTMTYYLATNEITKIEDSNLNPIFGDLLAPTVRKLGTVRLDGQIRVTRRSLSGRTLRQIGTLGPRTIGSNGRLFLYAGKSGQPLTYKGVKVLPAGASSFDASFTFPKGTSKYELRYTNQGVIALGSTPTLSVSVP